VNPYDLLVGLSSKALMCDLLIRLHSGAEKRALIAQSHKLWVAIDLLDSTFGKEVASV
jgi:hypothetical protein